MQLHPILLLKPSCLMCPQEWRLGPLQKKGGVGLIRELSPKLIEIGSESKNVQDG